MSGSESLILLSDTDHTRLCAFLASLKPKGLHQKLVLYTLEYVLQKASVVPEQDLPADVVRMNCRVWLQEVSAGAGASFLLAFPWEADLAAKKLSVLSTVGSAVLGRRAGEIIECLNSRKRARYRIRRIEEPKGERPGPAAGGRPSG